MEVITMESSALKMLTEQIADVAKLVALELMSSLS